MANLRVGIAGFGIVGKRRKNVLQKQDGVEVVAVCDQDPKQLLNPESGITFYNDYKSLFKENLDILFVCLTNNIAATVTKDALRRGLHVFCEKPPGMNMDDIESVIEVEKSCPGLKLMYGFNHRYHESVTHAQEVINSKSLGKIINMRAVYGKSQLVTFNQPIWRTNRKIAGGGVLLDQGIHMVDLMRLFGGDFNDVHSFVSNNHWNYDVEDNAYALMKTDDGIVGMLHSSATQWRHRFHLDINLEKGSIILGGILTSTISYGDETLAIILADPDNDGGDPKETITRYNSDPSWADEISYFIKCIENDTPVESSSSDDAYKTMQLVYRIYYADKSWRELYGIDSPDK